MAGTADLDLQGDIHTDYAAVLLRLGRPEEARQQLEAALGFYERKGDLAAAAGVSRPARGGAGHLKPADPQRAPIGSESAKAALPGGLQPSIERG